MKIPLLYKDRRLEGDTAVRQAQLIEHHLLDVFKKICDDHGLRFWLDGGTLIGALRHGGPVPWDDDLDVMILEPDYKKFLKFAKEELPDDVYLETPADNPRMENHITRLRDCYSWGLVRRDKRLLINDHHGVCIDIFPIRECSNDSRLARWLLRRLSSNYGFYKRAQYNGVTLANVLLKWIAGVKALLNKIAFELTQMGRASKYYVEASWFVNNKLWWPKEWLFKDGEPQRMVFFDGEKMPVPLEAEKVLTEYFGDWRQMPPESSQVGYLSVVLPTTPCFHDRAMVYPKKD